MVALATETTDASSITIISPGTTAASASQGRAPARVRLIASAPLAACYFLALPDMVRGVVGPWVMSIRRACAFGEAGMVTCRTPSE